MFINRPLSSEFQVPSRQHPQGLRGLLPHLQHFDASFLVDLLHLLLACCPARISVFCYNIYAHARILVSHALPYNSFLWGGSKKYGHVRQSVDFVHLSLLSTRFSFNMKWWSTNFCCFADSFHFYGPTTPISRPIRIDVCTCLRAILKFFSSNSGMYESTSLSFVMYFVMASITFPTLFFNGWSLDRYPPPEAYLRPLR